MKRIGGAKSARWLADSLQRFDWIGSATRQLPRKTARFASKVLDLIHAGQPFDAPSKHGLLMACGQRP
jgi:hypothetical protein